jgi:ABC-type Na+ efflux pump permease subunit
MKYAWLVAWREYLESTKAKGFWIGIFMIPAILFLTIQAPIWLEEKATPVRYFVIVDQSGTFGPKIQADFEKTYQIRVFQALQDYARKNSTSTNDDKAAALPRNVDDFMKNGGQSTFLKELAPRLKAGASAFQPPRRIYQAIAPPGEVHTNGGIETVTDELKPYVRGEKKVEIEGRPVDLAAALIIPADITNQIVRPAAKNSKSAPGNSKRDLTGEWHGALDIPQGQLRLVFKVKPGADGAWSASVDSLDQGASDIPVTSVALVGDTLRFEVPAVGGLYEGTLDKAGLEATGHWTQGPQVLPLDLQRSAPQAAIAEDSPSSALQTNATRHPSLGGIQFWSANVSDPKLRDDLEQAINSEIRQREYLARGLDAKIVHQVEQTYAPFATLNPKKEKGKESVNTVDTIRQWAPSAFVYLLWLSIFMIVQMLLTNTIEEKSNRIIEVLLSSVTPGELMMGKLLGIAAVGFTMISVWMLALFGILSWKSGGSSHLAGQMLTVLKGSNLVFVFTLYFMLGFLMYAGFILSIGSVCNTLKEAQSYMGVLTMIMMVPLLTMTFIPKDPNGSLARILSWIPLYTPFTMMNRASADPPTVDLVGTFILMMVCSIGAMWMSGKIFRIGILRTGQPPKIVEMVRWVFRKGM